jgi:Transmembrane secretion effector
LIGGLAWILALSTLNSEYQSTLPNWAKARGMSYYLVIFQGGGALGSAVLGVVAERAGLSTARIAAAIGLAVVAGVGLWFPFRGISPSELLPSGDWPDPRLIDATTPAGPVMVTVEYRPLPGREREVVDALYANRYARRRTGAVMWRVWRDAADRGRVLEQFVVGSWEEHLRQHERVSRRDQDRLDVVKAMTDPSSPPVVTHWLTASGPARRRHSATAPMRSNTPRTSDG